MKKYIFCALVIIGCLIAVLFIKILPSEQTITDSTKYLQVDPYVKNSLQEDFTGFLMDKANFNPAIAEYYYYYTDYEPAFVIYLEYHFESPEFFQQEIARIDSLAQEKLINNNMVLYSADSPSKNIEHYLDGKIYDGLYYFFEFAFIDQTTMTISYLTAYVQDNQAQSSVVLDFVRKWKIAQRDKGTGLLSPVKFAFGK